MRKTLPASAGASASEAATSEASSSEAAATAAAPTSEAAAGIASASATDEDGGTVVAPQPDDDDDENDESEEVAAIVVIIQDHGCSGWQLSVFQLRVSGFTRLIYSKVGIASPHIGLDEMGGDAVAGDVGQKFLKAHARCDEVLSVLNGDDNDQSGSGVLVAYAVFVAYILRHAEGIAVLHMPDNDEHGLHVELAVEFAEVVVGAVPVFLCKDVVGVADKLRGVGQKNHLDVVGAPDGIAVFCPFGGGSRQRDSAHHHDEHHP